jgi:hypothetical protein
VSVADTASGHSWAYVAAMYAERIMNPFEWIGPESSISRSMLAIPPRPSETRALTRLGRANEWSPRSRIASPLT